MYENNEILKLHENEENDNGFSLDFVVSMLREMAVETNRNLSNLQTHQNSTTKCLIDSYTLQIKSYLDLLNKPNNTLDEIEFCTQGINKINDEMKLIKFNDDSRVKEDKDRWKDLGETVVKIIGGISITMIIVKGIPTIIKSVTKK